MKLKVCIAGATGWVGKPLCVAVSEADDLTLVGTISRTQKVATSLYPLTGHRLKHQRILAGAPLAEVK